MAWGVAARPLALPLGKNLPHGWNFGSAFRLAAPRGRARVDHPFVIGCPPVVRAAGTRRGAGAVALVFACLAQAAGADSPRPPALQGILLVTIDTLRADHVGAYGAPFATPNLDALARDGVLIEQACSPTPSTGPAHASLLTGLYPWNHGTLRNAVPLDPRIPTLADRLREAGFTTAAFVS